MLISSRGLKKNGFLIGYMSISSYIRSITPKTKDLITYAEIQNLYKTNFFNFYVFFDHLKRRQICNGS